MHSDSVQPNTALINPVAMAAPSSWGSWPSSTTLEWQTCPALKYPRSLSNLLTAGEARAMAGFYRRQIHPRMSKDTFREGSRSIYGHLLESGLKREPGSDHAFDLLDRLWLRMADRLKVDSRKFVIAADFFSFRSPDSTRIFPDWHQDYAFWWTGARCTGFNLWVLLDHRSMNHSFDVYDVEQNPQLYEQAYERANRRAKRSLPGAGAYLSNRPVPSNDPRERATDWLLGHKQVSNVPLGVGDALVLKQLEIHRTDPLVREGQWRLALGLKVLERVPLVKGMQETSKLGRRLEALRAQWPGLLQRAERGVPFPNWYEAVGAARNLSSRRL